MAYATYDDFITALATELVVEVTNTKFVLQVPNIIQQAEQRIYRDLDLLSTVVRDSTGTLTGNSRDFTLPTSVGRFVTVQELNVFTPVGFKTTRHPMTAVSPEYLNAAWPSETASAAPSVPSIFAPVTDQQYVVGPPPDDAYFVEVVGTIRPAQYASGNDQTFLATQLPDLFFAAAMCAGSAYQGNWSQQGDDPKQGVSWEADYQQRLASANAEEMKRKWAVQGR